MPVGRKAPGTADDGLAAVTRKPLPTVAGRGLGIFGGEDLWPVHRAIFPASPPPARRAQELAPEAPAGVYQRPFARVSAHLLPKPPWVVICKGGSLCR